MKLSVRLFPEHNQQIERFKNCVILHTASIVYNKCFRWYYWLSWKIRTGKFDWHFEILRSKIDLTYSDFSHLSSLVIHALYLHMNCELPYVSSIPSRHYYSVYDHNGCIFLKQPFQDSHSMGQRRYTTDLVQPAHSLTNKSVGKLTKHRCSVHKL